MKKFKSIVALVLVLVMCVGMLCSCADNQPGVENSTPVSNESSAPSNNVGNEIPQYDYHLGCVVYSLADAIPVHIVEMLTAYSEMFGIKLTVVVGSGADGILAAVENLVAANVDGVFMHSAAGIESWAPVLENAGIPYTLGSTKVLTDSAKEIAANSKYFLGQVSYDDYEVMNILTNAAIASGCQNIGLVAPSNITPNYLGVRKQAVLDIVEKYNAQNGASVKIYEGTGSGQNDFAGFASSLLASYGTELDALITVTTADSSYQPILMAEMQGAIGLYAANTSESAAAAFADGTMKMYIAGSEHIAVEFLIMLNGLKGTPFKQDGYVDITTPSLLIDSAEKEAQLDEYYNDRVLYDGEFLCSIDSLEKLEAMAAAATLENFVSGAYTAID